VSPSIRTELKRKKAIVWPEAVRPAPGADIVPAEGYRLERFLNRQAGLSVPAVVAAADQSNLFELFLALLEPLGSVVDVFVESSHQADRPVRCLRRETIDAPVLASILYDFEDFLLQDGCTAITVAGTRSAVEVQLDEHKHLIVYSFERKAFTHILKDNGLRRRDELMLMFDVRHIHQSTPEYYERFFELVEALDMNETQRVAIG